MSGQNSLLMVCGAIPTGVDGRSNDSCGGGGVVQFVFGFVSCAAVVLTSTVALLVTKRMSFGKAAGGGGVAFEMIQTN